MFKKFGRKKKNDSCVRHCSSPLLQCLESCEYSANFPPFLARFYSNPENFCENTRHCGTRYRWPSSCSDANYSSIHAGMRNAGGFFVIPMRRRSTIRDLSDCVMQRQFFSLWSRASHDDQRQRNCLWRRPLSYSRRNLHFRIVSLALRGGGGGNVGK